MYFFLEMTQGEHQAFKDLFMLYLFLVFVL